ncbi:MAG: hypothetical protein DRO65_02830 [Candidatus Altiarchaeales archaeon]|nr:MAG: hypothetical protein DRO65_02830 [Candidatus Altiarchaeales archaeon]
MKVLKVLDSFFGGFSIKNLASDWKGIIEEVWPKYRKYCTKSFQRYFSGCMIKNCESIERVYLSVFPSRYTLSKLKDNSLLFVHHPLDWDEEKGFIPPQEKFLLRKICIYSSHLPLDNNLEYSPTISLVNFLGIKDFKVVLRDNFLLGCVVHNFSLSLLKRKLKEYFNFLSVQETSWGKAKGKAFICAGGCDDVNLLKYIHKLEGIEIYITGVLYFRGSEYAKKYNQLFINYLRRFKIKGVGISHYISEYFSLLKLKPFFEQVFGLKTKVIKDREKLEKIKRDFLRKIF